MSRKGGTQGRGWVHSQDEKSMTVSGLCCRMALIGIWGPLLSQSETLLKTD